MRSSASPVFRLRIALRAPDGGLPGCGPVARCEPRVQHAILLQQLLGGVNMFDRITHDPNVLSGRATLRGLRISVAHVVNLIANGMTPAQIVSEHPDLDEEDVRQALGYAAAIAEDQVHPIPAGK